MLSFYPTSLYQHNSREGKQKVELYFVEDVWFDNMQYPDTRYFSFTTSFNISTKLTTMKCASFVVQWEPLLANSLLSSAQGSKILCCPWTDISKELQHNSSS